MRLSVFIANTLSTQLIIDLQKIYLTYLPESVVNEQAISKVLAQTSSRLYLTMFNERHIGAVKVQLDTTQATLSDLCIREITRRRGVGKNLLKQVEKSLASEGIKKITYDLKEISEEELLNTQAFLSDSHYNIINKIATKAL